MVIYSLIQIFHLCDLVGTVVWLVFPFNLDFLTDTIR